MSTQRTAQFKRNRQGGFGLMEVMIASLVVSVGILATLSLQIAAKQANYDAIQRTAASQLAGDIFERMLANPDGLANYVTAGVGGGTLAAVTCTAAAPCSAQQLANYDLWDWEALLDGVTEKSAADVETGGLVSPTACVQDQGANVYTIAVAWRGRGVLSNPSLHDCGEGSGLYGANDEYRRVLVMTVFVS